MEDQPAEVAGPSAAGKVEPRKPTIADLIVAVAGVALALGLGSNRQVIELVVGGPGQAIGLGFRVALAVGLGFGVADLALATVILSRRGRFGGLPRAAEWLAVLAALPTLTHALSTGVVSLWAAEFVRTRSRADWLVMVAATLVAIVGVVAAVRGRPVARRLAWALGLAAAGVTIVLVQQAAGALFDRPYMASLMSGSPAGAGALALAAAGRVVSMLPLTTAWAVAAAATWLRWWRHRLAGALWTEWAATLLSLAGLAVVPILIATLAFGIASQPGFAALATVGELGSAVVFLAGLVYLSRRPEP